MKTNNFNRSLTTALSVEDSKLPAQLKGMRCALYTSFLFCDWHHVTPSLQQTSSANPETRNSARDGLEYRVHGWKFLREKGQSACLVLSINKQALPRMRGLMAGRGRSKT